MFGIVFLNQKFYYTDHPGPHFTLSFIHLPQRAHACCFSTSPSLEPHFSSSSSLLAQKAPAPGNQSHHHWRRCVGLFTPTPQKVEGCLQRGFLLLFLELYVGKVVSGFSNWNSDRISSSNHCYRRLPRSRRYLYYSEWHYGSSQLWRAATEIQMVFPRLFFRRKKLELIH